MAFNLKKPAFPHPLRGFLPQKSNFLLQLSADLKAAKYAGTEVPSVACKDIALIFERNYPPAPCLAF